MSQPCTNPELMNKVLDLIDARPDKWGQSQWFEGSLNNAQQRQAYDKGDVEHCGTVGCVSGWACLLSGEYKPLAKGLMIVDLVRVSDGSKATDLAKGSFNSYFLEEGARLLGLKEDDAYFLFMDMPYTPNAPHTFTDQVRAMFGLDLKWDTEVEFDIDKHNVLVRRPAEGETVNYLEAADA